MPEGIGYTGDPELDALRQAVSRYTTQQGPYPNESLNDVASRYIQQGARTVANAPMPPLSGDPRMNEQALTSQGYVDPNLAKMLQSIYLRSSEGTP